MTDCSQLQSALTQAIQARQDLDDPNYCADNSDTITEQELCRKRLSEQKLEADQEIARLQRDIELCSALIGTWDITASLSAHSGTLIITTWDNTGPFGGEMVFLDGSRGFTYANFDANRLNIQFNAPPLVYYGQVDTSTKPPSINGQIIDGVTLPKPTWSAVKRL